MQLEPEQLARVRGVSDLRALEQQLHKVADALEDWVTYEVCVVLRKCKANAAVVALELLNELDQLAFVDSQLVESDGEPSPC